MSEYDLMDGPSRLDSDELRKRADRLLLLHEFAIAYQYPTERDSERGYLTAWVRQDHVDTTAPQYTREQGMSGDDEMIRRMFSEMATEDTERIEKFIGSTGGHRR